MLRPQHETAIEASVFVGWHIAHSRTRIKKLTKAALLFVISIGVSLVTLRYLCVPLLVYAYPETLTSLLDSGIYGAYPVRKYFSSDLTSPQANVVQ